MIDLTPLDVRNKKEDFRRAVRGYDVAQVNAFLDLMAERFGQLVADSGVMVERVAALEEQLNHYREREQALNDALLTAQELREEMRSQAERDAALRLREAEIHAESIRVEAEQVVRQAQRQLKEIHSQKARLLHALRGILERFDENLQLEELRLEEEPEGLLERVDQKPPQPDRPSKESAS